MKSSSSTFGFSVLVVAGLAGTVRADMGTVWVNEVTSRSVTIDWSDPRDGHRLASGIPLYRVSWAPAEADERTLANSAKVIVGTSEKPYKFPGLDPGTHYRFKVEAHASVIDVSGDPFNPKYRQVGTIRQSTAPEGGGPVLRLAGAGAGSLQVEFTNPRPEEFQIIRVAYKPRWMVEDFCAIVRDPLGPRSRWVNPNETTGWVDVASVSVIRESLPPVRDRIPLQLLKDTSYEIVAYGFNIGEPEGTRLGNVQGKTSGATRFDCIEKAAAADHADIVDGYGKLVSSQSGDRRIVDLIGEDHPAIFDARAVLAADGDDLDVDFTALHYAIVGDAALFTSWQVNLAGDDGMTLARFLGDQHADLAASLYLEVGTPVFQRGDASPNGVLDIADPVRILSFLFDQSRGAQVLCLDAADANDSSDIDVSDGAFLLNFLFASGAEPPSPHGACGPDETPDDLDCGYYASCPMPGPTR